MCVCVYIYIYVYIYMCVCVYICVCIYIYVCVYIYMCVYIYKCVYIYIYIYVCVYIYICVYIHVCVPVSGGGRAVGLKQSPVAEASPDVSASGPAAAGGCGTAPLWCPLLATEGTRAKAQEQAVPTGTGPLQSGPRAHLSSCEAKGNRWLWRPPRRPPRSWCRPPSGPEAVWAWSRTSSGSGCCSGPPSERRPRRPGCSSGPAWPRRPGEPESPAASGPGPAARRPGPAGSWSEREELQLHRRRPGRRAWGAYLPPRPILRRLSPVQWGGRISSAREWRRHGGSVPSPRGPSPPGCLVPGCRNKCIQLEHRGRATEEY